MKKATLFVMATAALAVGWLLAPAAAPETAVVGARRDAWRLPDLPQRTDQAGKAIGLAASTIFEPEAAVLAAA
ncbi:MAG: hypothetical protein EOP39_28735, partial [Rubrivivax sp.]